ncbi:MAG: hypothetical protein LBV45_05765 [Xanthomonadaceae bacterium]|jgi:hypothetical protein|nr:hypothetical protein [Xanthomonadaceae bacterium]
MAELPQDDGLAGKRVGTKSIGRGVEKNAGRGIVSALGVWSVSMAHVGIDAGP